ncbi:MAG: hypothetical protein RI564_00815 [Gracilimonas sp.]|nr:hypothetical protein [Gracilimonas sp.]
MLSVLIIGGFVLSPMQTYAQEEESESPELGLWRGGQASLDFFLGPHFLNGGIQSRTGGVHSPRIEGGAFLVNTNPAMLGDLKKADVRINSRVGLGTSIFQSFVDITGELNSQIATETDSIFTNTDNFAQTPNTRIIPTEVSNLNAGIPATVESIAFAYPVNDRLAFSLSYANSVLTDFQLRLNGLSAKLAQEEGTDDVSIRFDVLMNIAAYGSFRAEMDIISLGIGTKVVEYGPHEVFLGGTIHRYSAKNERLISTDLSGMVVVGFADERFFNNENDPNLNPGQNETNDLFFRAKGNFTDMKYGYRTGLSYRYFKSFTLSALYVNNPRLELTDPAATSAAFLPVFVIGDDILSGDIEVVLEDLEANKPNLTTPRDVSRLVNPGVLQIPSYVEFATDIPIHKHTVALNYRQYLTDFEVGIGDGVFGKRNPMAVGVAADFAHTSTFKRGGWALIPFRLLLLDIDGLLFQAFKKYTKYTEPHITFGGSVMLGEGFAEEGASDFRDIMDLPTPLGFNIGRNYEVFDGINLGFNLLGYPNLAFSYSVGISF